MTQTNVADEVNLLDYALTSGRLGLFSKEAIDRLSSRLSRKDGRFYVHCLVRNKQVPLRDDEIIKQLWLDRLQFDYLYSIERLRVDVSIPFGLDTSKRADIVITDFQRPTFVYAVLRTRQEPLRLGKEQLKLHCQALSAPLALWSDGSQFVVWHHKHSNYFVEIPDLPTATEEIETVINQPWTIQSLADRERGRAKDGLPARALKQIVEELEDEVLSNAGVDVFEEVFKLIFIKLFDELSAARGIYPYLRFRNTNTASDLKLRLDDMFSMARSRWPGVFASDDRIRLSPEHLQVCVGTLEECKLYDSDLEVIDEAFEYLINKTSKGEKGQFFTPRWIIEMCVRMLNPQEHESMIDTAAGSSGFTVHTLINVWKQIDREEGRTPSDNLTTKEKSTRQLSYVRDKVFAIDFDEKAVRVARCLNLIAGDGQTNVLHLNTLDFGRWHERVTDHEWYSVYQNGWDHLRSHLENLGSYRDFNFDILMANPPFAGDVKQTDILSLFELGKKPNGRFESRVPRDVLFVERNLDFLRPGGRMAIVLPQGRLNNPSDKRLREFIAARCRIIGAVGLDPNTFKPHTGTKTSVLIVQKWNDDPALGPLCPFREDYNIFFATQKVPSKDNSGDKLHAAGPEGPIRDSRGRTVVSHDLYNVEGLTGDGIAEAFSEFARQESLSFFDPGPCDLAKLQGPNISVVSLRECVTDLNWRLDPEFHANQRPANDRYLYSTIGEALLQSQYGLSISMNEEGVGYPIYRMNELEHMLTSLAPQKYADVSPVEARSFVLKEGDVLFNRTNSLELVGRTGVYLPFDNAQRVFASYLVRLVPDSRKVTSGYLASFLSSKAGQVEIRRRARISINQSNVNPEEVKSIRIPLLSNSFQSLIDRVFRSAHELRLDSSRLYAVADRTLTLALDLNSLDTEGGIATVRSAKDVFVNDRWDSEFQARKVQSALEKLRSAGGSIGSVAGLRKERFFSGGNGEVDDGDSFGYIQIGDVRSDGTADSTRVAVNKAPDRAHWVVRAGDVISSLVRPIRGLTALVQIEQNRFVCSSGFVVLESRGVFPELLVTYLRLKPIRELLDLYTTATMYPALTPEVFMAFPMPVIDKSIALTVVEAFRAALIASQDSRRMLDAAMIAVDVAIEGSESEADRFLREETGLRG